jgi:superoxide dismutase, Fe-Mn family
MKSSRRKFIKQLSLAAAAVTSDKLFGNSIVNFANTNPVFTLPKLNYSYNALEPYIDTATMEIHHGKHHQTYITNLNKALATSKLIYKNIESLCQQVKANTDLTIRNNAGGHFNHSFFWEIMQANTNKDMPNLPTGKILEKIEQSFGSFDNFKIRFEEAAMKRFGSGWVWLYDIKDKLKIGSTPNQDNPLMPLSEIKGRPLLALDVWEHAYYLKYQNKRAEYITNWWNLVNWTVVNTKLSTK